MTPRVSETPSGARLVERLRRYDFELVSPPRRLTEQARVRDIRRFRSEVYREFGSLPDHIDTTMTGDDTVDREAWHIVAQYERQLVGCLRCTIFNHPLRSEVPELVLQNSGCRLAPAARAICLSSIHAFLVSRRPEHSPLPQFGGFAVSSAARGTAVATGLCLAATAFTRALASGGGLLLAAEKSRAERLYARAGGFRLLIDGEPVPALNDAFHRDRILVMGSAPFGNDVRLEPVVEMLRSSLFQEHPIKEAASA